MSDSPLDYKLLEVRVLGILAPVSLVLTGARCPVNGGNELSGAVLYMASLGRSVAGIALILMLTIKGNSSRQLSGLPG